MGRMVRFRPDAQDQRTGLVILGCRSRRDASEGFEDTSMVPRDFWREISQGKKGHHPIRALACLFKKLLWPRLSRSGSSLISGGP